MTDGDIVTFHDGGLWRNRVEGGPVLAGSYVIRSDAMHVGLLEARVRGVDHVATYAARAYRPRRTR